MTGPAGNIVNGSVVLLEDVRNEPSDWPSVDLEQLLTGWGFILDPNHHPSRFGDRLYIHPAHPDLNVVLFPNDRTHAQVSLHVVAIIDTLRQRA